jgi:hypothetical protein
VQAQLIVKRIKDNEILIREHKNAWRKGVLNFDTRKINWDSTLTWTSKMLKPKRSAGFDYNGLSQKFGNSRLTIFRYRNRLNVMFENQLIELNEKIESELKQIGMDLILTLKQDGKILLEHKHKQIKSVIPIENDSTPFVEAEDFDLRILIHNVLTANGRSERIFKKKPAHNNI